MTTLDTIYLKDAYGTPFPAAVVPIGESSVPLNVAAHVLLDQYGDAIATAGNPLFVSPIQLVVSASFTRLSNATPYANGALIANSATAGSVVPLSWNVARYAGGSASILRARMLKSGTGFTYARFRLHLYNLSPVPANGDGGLWLTPASGYVGSFTFDCTGANARDFSNGIQVIAVSDVGTLQVIDTIAPTLKLYGLVEYLALASGETYTPTSAEVFTFALEVQQN
jgi:hypothetical protein